MKHLKANQYANVNISENQDFYVPWQHVQGLALRVGSCVTFDIAIDTSTRSGFAASNLVKLEDSDEDLKRFGRITKLSPNFGLISNDDDLFYISMDERGSMDADIGVGCLVTFDLEHQRKGEWSYRAVGVSKVHDTDMAIQKRKLETEYSAPSAKKFCDGVRKQPHQQALRVLGSLTDLESTEAQEAKRTEASCAQNARLQSYVKEAEKVNVNLRASVLAGDKEKEDLNQQKEELKRQLKEADTRIGALEEEAHLAKKLNADEKW